MNPRQWTMVGLVVLAFLVLCFCLPMWVQETTNAGLSPWLDK